MAVDESLRRFWSDSQAATATLRTELARGGGGHQPPPMDTEMALLRQRADQTDQRLERMEGKLDRLDERMNRIVELLGAVATKDDVREAKRAAWQGLGVGSAIAFAVVTLFVAVLAYLQDQRVAGRVEPPNVAAAAPSAPMIIQLPPWPAAPLAPAPQPQAN